VGLHVSSGVDVAYSSTSLLRELHARYLISTRLLTTWLADHLLVANLAQVGFIVQLIGSYVPDMTRHVVNARICVRGACEKLNEVGPCGNEADGVSGESR
jgi:mediator of RNA polymerase II transcription subunit 12